MTAEEFGARLNQLLLDKPDASDGYLHINDLRECITQALSPQKISIEFPLALYKGKQLRLVNTPSEKEDALREGYGHVPPNQFEPDFPQWWIEQPVNPDGSRHADLRGILLRSSEEFRQFADVVEVGDWCRDEARQHGARATSLNEWKAKRCTELIALINTETFSAEVEAAPCDTVVESFTETGRNPDEVAPEAPSAQE